MCIITSSTLARRESVSVSVRRLSSTSQRSDHYVHIAQEATEYQLPVSNSFNARS